MGRVFNKYNHLIMRRLLSTGSLLKFNYLQSYKKPVVSIPSTTPPKYIYQPLYHPTSMPDFDMKFRDHEHFDDWFTLVYGEEDKFEFQYSGQWWDAVGISGRVVILTSMIWLLVALYEAAENRRVKHLPGFISYHSVGDISASHIPTIIEH